MKKFYTVIAILLIGTAFLTSCSFINSGNEMCAEDYW